MNLANIELYAQQIIFNTEYKNKSEAQGIFRDFVMRLDVSQYPQIMEKFSQNVFFVFLMILNEKIPKSQEVVQIFNLLKTVVITWHQPNGQFRRTYDSEYLKQYVVNYMGMVLGKCMKHIYLIEKTRKDLANYCKAESNSLFKLFLYKHFIEVVSEVDNNMEYVPYRTLVNSFQENMIPIFLQELYPYFISVTDTIKINQLGSMLPTLSQKKIVHKFDLFRPEDKIISELVFSLLREIVSFKFNITFSEYDFQGEIEHCMVRFPESVLTHLISKEFLEAFYFMLEKMVAMNYTGPYCDTSFECLKKILLSKVSHLTNQQKKSITQVHFIGLFRLIQSNITSEQTMNSIFESIFKFIHAFELTGMQNYQINHIQLASVVQAKALIVIQQTELSNQNRLYHSACMLLAKIASESLAIDQQKKVQFYEQMCRNFYRAFFDAFISKDHNIFGKLQIDKISSLIAILNEFFLNINKIGSIDMEFMLKVIFSRCEQVFLSKNPTKIANYLFLIRHIVQENFYDRNLVFEKTKEEDLKILGSLIHKCFEFIDFYKKTPTSEKLIDISILLFFERILSQTLGEINNNDENIIISSPTYQVINSYKKIPTTDENFLMFCFNELGLSLHTQDYEKVEYVLEVFYTLLLKLKWKLKRQFFTQSKIAKEILQQMIELSRNSLQQSPALLKERRKLFKIITILSFDDMLDSYRSNIDLVIESLAYDFANNQFSKIIFDMSGICENIEAPIIYKYFLAKVNERIGLEVLIRTLYQHFGNDPVMLEHVVYFNRSLLSDKSLRMTSRQLAIFIYEIADYEMEYVSALLDCMRNSSWSDVLFEVFNLVNVLFDASYINLFLIKRKSKDKFIAFLYKLIDNILVNYQWAQFIPELAKVMHETLHLFFTSCSEVIFAWEDNSQAQHELFTKLILLIQCVMNSCQKSLQQSAQSGKNYQLSEKFLDTISKLYSFMKYKRNSTHRKLLMENIQRVQIENQLPSVNFLQALYKISMTNIKNIGTVLNAICICIMELSYFYPNVHRQIFVSLGISNSIIDKTEIMYAKIEKSSQNHEFVIDLRNWLSKQENHYESESIDY